MMTQLQARIPPPEAVIAVRCPPIAAVLGVAAAVLYAGSFLLPAYHEAAGYQAFMFSFVCVIGIPMWLANPVFLSGLALLSQGKYRSAGKAGLWALVLALSECWLFSGGLRVGYYVWVASMALLAAAGWWGQLRRVPVHGPWGAGEATCIAARFRAVGHGPGPRSQPHASPSTQHQASGPPPSRQC
jgi:hypothetical protein